MVFELASQNVLTLSNYFDDPLVGIPLNLITKVVIDTLEGLAFMHSIGVIHADLKPENVSHKVTLVTRVSWAFRAIR
jgi:serine/threonine protein kinase